MDKNGQMTFSDDPVLNSINEVYQLIERGEYGRAVEILDGLLDMNPDYPGLIESYRCARFWHNREKYIKEKAEGKDAAEFLIREWKSFEDYAAEKGMLSSSAYRAAMRHTFITAADHFRTAFNKQQDTAQSFSYLLNLGECFLRLEEYNLAVESMEYARSSSKTSAKMYSILGEAYFHLGDIPRSLLCFREAFFLNPADIDMTLLKAKPILDLIGIIQNERGESRDEVEWIPVYAFLNDVFYVRKNLSAHQIDTIQNDIYNLEVHYQRMSDTQLEKSSILPRLINKYLWLLDYYEFQNYNFDRISQIRERLIAIDPGLFKDYFMRKSAGPNR